MCEYTSQEVYSMMMAGCNNRSTLEQHKVKQVHVVGLCIFDHRHDAQYEQYKVHI
jgi:hypothetical protein